jgi:hypothetical protein
VQELGSLGATLLSFTIEVILKDIPIEQDQNVGSTRSSLGRRERRVGRMLRLQLIVILLETSIVIEERSELLKSRSIGVVV